MMFGIPESVSLWCGFFFSLLFTTITTVQLSFNTYALSVKETFNLTQTQVEMVASMGTVGLGLSCLECVCTWMFGYTVTSVIIAVGVPGSSALFSLATHYSQFIHAWPCLIYFIQLFMSAVNNFGYFAVSRVCVENFPKEHTGKLVGLYMAFCCFGKIYFSLIIEFFFPNDLAGLFLSVSITSAIIYIGCCVFLYPIAIKKEEIAGAVVGSKEDVSLSSSSEATISDVLLSSLFHRIFWTSVVFYGINYASVANITSIAESVGVDNPLITVYVLSVVILFVRVLYGIVFDKFQSLLCGYLLLLTSYFSFIFASIICISYLNKSNMIYATVLIGVAMGPGLTVPLSVMLWVFGRRHYSAIIGSFSAMSCLCQALIQVITGFFYDSEIRYRGLPSSTCQGRECFYWSFCIMLSITCIVAIAQALNYIFSSHYNNALQRICKVCMRQ